VIIAMVLVVFLFNAGMPAKRAEAYGVTDSNLNPPNSFDSNFLIDKTQRVIGDLPSPITNFINDAKQIGVNLTTKATEFNLNSLNPRSIFDQIGDWFYGATGFRLTDIFKKIGALLVFLLTAVADAIRWAMSRF